jgi:hypothetical protein
MHSVFLVKSGVTPLHMLARVRYTPESPPGVAFQRDTIFMSLIIPGHPESNMGVYMEPLWDELISAWEEGVWTYDRDKRSTFKMYVWYQYSIHDFLAYGLFSAWCVH